MTDVACNRCEGLKAALLLGALIGLIFANSLNAAWQFDDLPNITRNEKLHISDLSPASLYQTFFASPATHDPQKDALFRPVAMLTLALNWYVDRDHVRGYHVVNLCIHVLTAWLLYAAIRHILAAPNIEGRYRGQEYDIALLSAVLWAVNPVQTQAVTYIVQRMTSLAALFYIGGVLCYLIGRQHPSPTQRWRWWSGTGLCFLLSIGAKENGVVLPVALILVEYLFFQEPERMDVRRKLLILSAVAIFLAVAAGLALLVAFRSDFLAYLTDLYSQRSFTLLQRLLTQPRVLLHYLSLLFLPLPDRLSLIHEIDVSVSLLKPYTTLPSILTILAMIGVPIYWARRFPLVALALLFFFLNHAVEGSFLPLEMMFEHRNYLPTLFLFVPVAAFLINLTNRPQSHGRIASFAPAVLIVAIVFGLGLGTWARNAVWATPKTLWRDVFAKSPNSARANQNIAAQFKEQKDYRKALAMYQRSLELQDPVPQRSRALALTNMANIYIELRNFPMAVRLLRAALNADPDNALARFNLIRPLAELDRMEEASAIAAALLHNGPAHPEYLNIKGFLLYRQGRFDDALSFLRAALHKNPGHFNARINLGMTLSRRGYFEQAKRLLEPLLQEYPKDPTVLLCLIDNAMQADQPEDIETYSNRLFYHASVTEVMARLSPKGPEALVPYDRDRLAAFVSAWLKHRLDCHPVLDLQATGNAPKGLFLVTCNIGRDSARNREELDRIYALIKEDKLKEALETVNTALSSMEDSRPFLVYKAWALLRSGDLEASLASLQSAMREDLHDAVVYHLIGSVMGRKGMHARGEWFLNRARAQSPNDVGIGLSLVENRLLAGDRARAAAYAQSLIDRYPWNRIENVLTNSVVDLANHSMVRSFLVEHLKLRLN